MITGSIAMLLLTGQTMNIQSYMGTIMAVGVAIANAVLYITYAEQLRKAGQTTTAALDAANVRLRPILMTSLAMIAGMIPMASGLGEGGSQTAPLGIAVIGGLITSVISVLFFLPQVYHFTMRYKKYRSVSLDPDDTDSLHYSVTL